MKDYIQKNKRLFEKHWHSVLPILVQSEFQPQISPEGCAELVTVTIVYIYSDLS